MSLGLLRLLTPTHLGHMARSDIMISSVITDNNSDLIMMGGITGGGARITTPSTVVLGEMITARYTHFRHAAGIDLRSKTMGKPIPSRDLVGVIGGHLLKLGFVQSYRSKSGTRYLNLKRQPFQIRVSDHSWSVHSRNRHVQVVRSVCLQPIPTDETWLFAVEQAIRYMVACEVRKIL